MKILFLRNTHFEGEPREFTDGQKAVWLKCRFSGHLGDPKKAMTFSELVVQHQEYAKVFSEKCPTTAELLRGLSELVENDMFKVVVEYE